MGQRPVSKCKAHRVYPERDQQNTYMKHQQEKITEATYVASEPSKYFLPP